MENMLSQDELQAARELRNDFEKKITGPDRKIWNPAAKDFLARRECWTQKPLFRGQNIRAMLEDWEDHFKRNFNLKVDLSRVRIPIRYREEADFNRLLFIPREAQSLDMVYEALESRFPCLRLNDLDKIVAYNRRDPAFGSYAVWVRDLVEADEQHGEKSAIQLLREGVNSITLLERTLFESKYFDEKNEHLDSENETLCAGSRDLGGSVPSARWHVGRFEVGWFDAGNSLARLRSREVVS